MMRSTTLVLCITLLFTLVLCEHAPKKPNILIFLADDMGWADAGFNGAPTIRTETLDRLAANGMRLNQFYAGESICSPSRSSMLTGRYPVRTGIYSSYDYPYDNLFRVFYPTSLGSLPETEHTIASLLKSQSYTSAMIGKWHLGHVDALPVDRGFDYFFGLPYSHDEGCPPGLGMPCNTRGTNVWPGVPLFRNREIIEQPVNLETIVDRYSFEASSFIEKAKKEGNPFFMVVAYEEPHIPLFASAEFEGKSLRGLYGDMIMAMDHGIGTIMKKLEDLKIDDNTLVFFTSDNGAWTAEGLAGGSNGIFRGEKGTTFEGGFRVPTLAYWPKKIPAGSVNMGITCMMDLFSTAIAAAGVEVPADVVIDGVNLLPALTKNAPVPRDCFFLYRSKYLQAARCGQFKAHYLTRVGFGDEPPVWHNPPILYNVDQDPGERFPLNSTTLAQYQDVLNYIDEAVRKHNETLGWGVSQFESLDKTVAPCCNPENGCYCGNEGYIPTPKNYTTSHNYVHKYHDLTLLFDDEENFAFPEMFYKTDKKELDPLKYKQFFG